MDMSDEKSDLESILAEIKDIENGADAKPDALKALQKELEETKKKLGEFDTLKQSIDRKTFEDELTATVGKVKKANPSLANLPDKVVRGWLQVEAEGDKTISEAWAKRSEDPKAFDEVLNGVSERMGSQLTAEQERRSRETQEREAINAFVRSRSGEMPVDPDIPPQHELNAMSSQQLRDIERKQIAKRSA